MEATVYVKYVGEKEQFVNSKGEQITKLTVIMTQKECRTIDGQTLPTENDLVFELLNDRAENFYPQQGEWLCISYMTMAHEYNGRWFGENRLGRYCRI